MEVSGLWATPEIYNLWKNFKIKLSWWCVERELGGTNQPLWIKLKIIEEAVEVEGIGTHTMLKSVWSSIHTS